jgi:hypothetical protein
LLIMSYISSKSLIVVYFRTRRSHTRMSPTILSRCCATAMASCQTSLSSLTSIANFSKSTSRLSSFNDYFSGFSFLRSWWW